MPHWKIFGKRLSNIGAKKIQNNCNVLSYLPNTKWPWYSDGILEIVLVGQEKVWYLVEEIFKFGVDLRWGLLMNGLPNISLPYLSQEVLQRFLKAYGLAFSLCSRESI